METTKFLKNVPHLPVKDLQQTLDYYVHTLGFTEPWTAGVRDGGVRRDDLRLLFSEDPEFVEQMNNHTHRLPLLWLVNNLDKVHGEFQLKRIPIAAPLQQHSYGLWEFAFLDVNGYYIRIAEEAHKQES